MSAPKHERVLVVNEAMQRSVKDTDSRPVGVREWMAFAARLLVIGVDALAAHDRSHAEGPTGQGAGDVGRATMNTLEDAVAAAAVWKAFRENPRATYPEGLAIMTIAGVNAGAAYDREERARRWPERTEERDGRPAQEARERMLLAVAEAIARELRSAERHQTDDLARRCAEAAVTTIEELAPGSAR
jgi:hypothetical protein